jgi:hypothetical protein
MSELKVNKISPRSGTDVTLGDSGDTFTLPTGVTLDTSNSTVTLPDSSISLAKLTATGTKDATTFLRGDNTFAEAGGGKILQVVQGTLTSSFSTNSSSFVATGLNVSITPSSTSSKIFVTTSGYLDSQNPGSSIAMEATIYRGATNIGATNGMISAYIESSRNRTNASMSIVDEPSTTSATTYEVYIKADGSTFDYNSQSSKTTIIAMEIGA